MKQALLGSNMAQPLVSASGQLFQKMATLTGSHGASFLVLDSKPEDALGGDHERNLFRVFDSEWPKRLPIVMKNVHRRMDASLWTCAHFLTRYQGEHDINVDLINCENGKLIKDQSMNFFWRGFENGANGECLLDTVTRKVLRILKLKDWPPAKDFESVLPDQYKDLMENLPVREYTNRDGSLNLASYMPDHFLKPDLGPKLYIAYSSADTPKAGTTNLHIDISDAFNIIMYVGQNQPVEPKKSRPPKAVNNTQVCETYSV